MLENWQENGCPMCGSKQVEDFFDVAAIPVEVGLLWKSLDEARKAKLGRILLALCNNCGFVGNRAFEPSLIDYSPGYEISLHFSKVYESFLVKLAEHLISRFSLKDANVVEIGCGQGHFLKMLCTMAGCNGYGFDPCVKEETNEVINGHSFKLIRDFYDLKQASLPVDLICCRHVLQSIAKPIQFLETMAKTAGDATVYFEMPNATYAFGTKTKWNFMYEYISYFHSYSLRRLFQTCRLTPIRVTPCYEDDQYLSIEATIQDESPEQHEKTGDLLEFIEQVRKFSQAVQSSIKKWQSVMESYKDKKVVIWGAGGRAISFMSALALGDQINCLVDINPSRQDMYIPVTGQKVVRPEYLKDNKPDLLLISNPTYENEIRKELNNLDCNPEVRVI